MSADLLHGSSSGSGTPNAGSAPSGASPATEDLLDAVRSLFTCTRKVRGWVSDSGAVTVLSTVDGLGESRVSAVAAVLHMDISTVSRSLSALTREGLLEQRPDPADARSHLVRCSAAGLARLAERRAQFAEELERRLVDWPAQDVTDLSRLLHRFVASVLDDATCSPTSATPQSPAPQSPAPQSPAPQSPMQQSRSKENA